MHSPSQGSRAPRLINFDDFNLTGSGIVDPPSQREEELRSEPVGFVDPFLYGPREFGFGPISHTPEWGEKSVFVAPVEMASATNNGYLDSHLGKDGAIPNLSWEPCDFHNFAGSSNDF